jgi:putative transposase
VSVRTFQRWVAHGEAAVRADGRTTAERPPPSNRLSEAERQQILEVASQADTCKCGTMTPRTGCRCSRAAG